ncbi:hypothetical protein HMPREF9080_00334 [Cardiobacterium valvarum F0432]|uniref:Uncharacterized protein n=1 Tax=Cardiobacterium valvarum F0432 TaxID=797473 RepID=G9ZC58_9GAMM|nr:hypothetical protein HMPREF9080_00334 [Cardiobacterium valvarum F0432]
MSAHVREAARGGVFFEPLCCVGLGKAHRRAGHTARRGNGAQAAIDEPFAAVDVVRAPLVLVFADGAGFPLGLQLFQFFVFVLQDLLAGLNSSRWARALPTTWKILYITNYIYLYLLLDLVNHSQWNMIIVYTLFAPYRFQMPLSFPYQSGHHYHESWHFLTQHPHMLRHKQQHLSSVVQS